MQNPSRAGLLLSLAAFSLIVVFAGPAVADGTSAPTWPEAPTELDGASAAKWDDGADIAAGRRGLTIGFVTGQFSYGEKGMRDSGLLNGIGVAFDRREPDSKFGVRLEGDLMAGALNYEGALIDIRTMTSTPHTTPTFDVIMNGRALLGLALDAGSAEIRPFLGGGLRYLNDNMEGEGSYEREVTYLYVPAGVSLALPVVAGWNVRAAVEYDRLIAGTVKSHLTQLGRATDPENHQGNGDGFRASLDISGSVSERFDLHIVPYYQEWHVQDSDLQYVDKTFGYALEPENRTEIFGVNIALGI